MYKVGCILWINQTEGIPCFAILKAIYVPEQQLEDIVFLVHQLETKEFNAHLKAYEISDPENPVPMIFKQRNLKYHLPLHIINPCFQHQRKSYVCPKYEYPSEE